MEGGSWVEVALYLLCGLGGGKSMDGSNGWEMGRGQVWLLVYRVCLVGISGMWFVRNGKGSGMTAETKSGVEVNFD